MDSISNTVYVQGLTTTPQHQQTLQSGSSQVTALSTHVEAVESVQVELSEQGKEKSLQESTQQALRNLLGEEVETKEGGDPQKVRAEMIDKLKEQIADLLDEKEALGSKADEDSANKVKALEMQISLLTTQLTALLNQSLDLTEQ